MAMSVPEAPRYVPDNFDTSWINVLGRPDQAWAIFRSIGALSMH